MEDVWVDGRYVNKNNRIDLKATYAQHPTSDILVRNKTFTNASGKPSHRMSCMNMMRNEVAGMQ